MKDKKLDQMIKSSLEENLTEIQFENTMKEELLEATVKKENNIINKLKNLLNHEVEVPVTYMAVFLLGFIGNFGYQMFNYFPDPSEISAFQFEWIIINLKGVL
jgi:hypothetical protein